MNHWILTLDNLQMIVTNLDRNLMKLSAAKQYFSAYGVVIKGNTKKSFIKNLSIAVRENQTTWPLRRLDMNTYPDVVLSTGRTIRHERHEAGYQVAIPTSGPQEMTEDEWIEYQQLFQNKAF